MGSILRADLGSVRLASLLQLAEGEMVSGQLTVPGGAIGLRDGEIVSATAGRLSGLDALRELFLVTRGPTELVTGPRPEGAVMGGTLALVMEGCRVADEWDRLGPLVLGATDRNALEGLPKGVARRLDGRRSVFEICRELELPAVAVLETVRRLVDDAVLVEVAPARTEEVRRLQAEAVEAAAAPVSPAPTPAPSPPVVAAPAAAPASGDYFRALEAGRIHLRSGDLAEAERGFRAALDARPGDRIATQNLRRVQSLRAAGDVAVR